MITVAEALRRIRRSVRPLGAETVRLERALGRVLAEDIRAREPLPPFDNATMDGYAVRSADLLRAAPGSPAALKVVSVVRAGSSAGPALHPGQAVKIMTGAPVPRGADAVVMNEEARLSGGTVYLSRPHGAGEFIRLRGEDVRPGEGVLRRGTRLRAFEIAWLASQGRDAVRVARRPRAAVLSSGDELVPLGARPSAGRIRDANGPALAAALRSWGLEVLDLGIVRDEPRAVEGAFRRALGEADLVLASGGVSKGDFDFTKPILDRLGLKVVFWHVAVRPGKPILFGLKGLRPVFGLPGNPLSVLVCLEQFVRPAIERLEGLEEAPPSLPLTGTVAGAFELPRGRQQFLFARAEPGRGSSWRLRILKPQASHMMARACRANALALSPEGRASLRSGDVLSFKWLS